jgi:tRNA(Ile)-lysidine synthase
MAGSGKSRSTNALSAVVADSLSRYVGTVDRVAVGLSGGLDSVVLLHAIRACRMNLSAVHIHHGLSDQADAWAEFCQSLCARWHIPLVIQRVVVERRSPSGLEAAARAVRHAVFDDTDADWIALGHHVSDRAETMLLNIFRGAGIRGAGAMRERNGRLLRPLLKMGRSEIRSYAREFGLTWVEDDSNIDTRYSRNFLRHRIVPEIKHRYPAVEDRLASAAARFAEAGDLLDDLARLDLGETSQFPIAVERLANLPEPRARNILRYLLATQGVGIPSEERLAEALRQCLTAAPDRHPRVAFGQWILFRQGRHIKLDRRCEAQPLGLPTSN